MFIHRTTRTRSFTRRDDNRKSLAVRMGRRPLWYSCQWKLQPPCAITLHGELRTARHFYSYEPPTEIPVRWRHLKFPSAIETPYPENNTVWGRFFGAARDLAGGRSSAMELQLGRPRSALSSSSTRRNHVSSARACRITTTASRRIWSERSISFRQISAGL